MFSLSRAFSHAADSTDSDLPDEGKKAKRSFFGSSRQKSKLASNFSQSREDVFVSEATEEESLTSPVNHYNGGQSSNGTFIPQTPLDSPNTPSTPAVDYFPSRIDTITSSKPVDSKQTLKSPKSSYLPFINLSIQQSALSGSDQKQSSIDDAESSKSTSPFTNGSNSHFLSPTDDADTSSTFPRRRRAPSSFLEKIAESNTDTASIPTTSSTPSFNGYSGLPNVSSDFTRRLEEMGRLRRLERLSQHSKADSENSEPNDKLHKEDQTLQKPSIPDVVEEEEEVVEEDKVDQDPSDGSVSDVPEEEDEELAEEDEDIPDIDAISDSEEKTQTTFLAYLELLPPQEKQQSSHKAEEVDPVDEDANNTNSEVSEPLNTKGAGFFSTNPFDEPPSLPPSLPPKDDTKLPPRQPPPGRTIPPTPPVVDAQLVRELEEARAAIQQAKAQEDTLRSTLSKLRGDLADTRMENARLATVKGQQEHELTQLRMSLRENTQLHDLLRQQKEETKAAKAQAADSQALIRKLQQENRDLKMEIQTSQVRLTKKDKEQKEWDIMHLKLARAERQIRTLDNLTRFKLESRQETGFGLSKRRGKFAGTGMTTDIIRVLNELNEEILQASLTLSEAVDMAMINPTAIASARARHILGTRLSSLLTSQKSIPGSKINLLVMQVLLEVYFVHWSVDIIEGHYPKQQSFADLLIDIGNQSTSSVARLYTPQPVCGRQTQIIPPATTTPYVSWHNDIYSELNDVLSTGGIVLRNAKRTMITSKIQQLVKLAYSLRQGLAEKDNLAGMELKVIGPDTLYQSKFMEDAHPDPLPRKVATTADFVLGTAGIGLQKDTSTSANNLSVEIIVKPKVVLPGILFDS